MDVINVPNPARKYLLWAILLNTFAAKGMVKCARGKTAPQLNHDHSNEAMQAWVWHEGARVPRDEPSAAHGVLGATRWGHVQGSPGGMYLCRAEQSVLLLPIPESPPPQGGRDSARNGGEQFSSVCLDG